MSVQPWLYTAPDRTIQLLTFNTPVDAPEAEQCGRVVFSQFHVAQGTNTANDNQFPSACDDAPMTPQEKALEFMLFDLSACVTSDRGPIP